MLIKNKELNNMNTELTEARKKELDNYSEEDIYYFWNIFTQKELDYINKCDNNAN